MATENKKLMTSREASAWLGMSKTYVQRHTANKPGSLPPYIPSVSLGKQTRYTLAGLEKFIADNQQ